MLFLSLGSQLLGAPPNEPRLCPDGRRVVQHLGGADNGCVTKGGRSRPSAAGVHPGGPAYHRGIDEQGVATTSGVVGRTCERGLANVLRDAHAEALRLLLQEAPQVLGESQCSLVHELNDIA